MALTRDEVVRVAVALLDQVGLEGLTLRRLATELGVSAPTLYWHVRNKRELLDLMAEAIMAEGPAPAYSPAPGQPWWDWLAEQARHRWRAMVSHRDAALVVAGNRPTEAAMAGIDQTIGSLVAVGFPAPEALRAVLSLGNYIVGCAVEHQAELARGADMDDAALARMHRAEEFPHLAAAAGAHAAAEPAGFEHGLALLIRGLRARHAELTASLSESGAPRSG
jgi:TetR/AcrR family tetracycline transcriptional repressor